MSQLQNNHAARKHAKLSPSGADRWLACPPSAELESSMPDQPTTYSREGTLAHELADITLRSWLKGQQVPKKYLEQIRRSPFYSEDMPGYVQVYTDYVAEQYTAAVRQHGSALLKIEDRVDLREFVPNSFGTNDAMIISDGTLEVVDLKYGKGVPVSAVDNSQLKLYALGAYWKYELSYNIENIRLTIVQPRLDSISSWELSASELLEWALHTVKPRARQAWEGKGDLQTGDHCRWCKAKPKCPALAEESLAIAQHEFAPPKLLSDEAILDIYSKLDRLVDWAKSVSEYMLARALEGKHWPGLKVVEGRSQRRWSDPDRAIALLRKKGYKKSDIVEEKIKGITKIEKLLGAEKFSEILAPVIVKPPGKPTLVPESDNRPAFSPEEQARSDFK